MTDLEEIPDGTNSRAAGSLRETVAQALHELLIRAWAPPGNRHD